MCSSDLSSTDHTRIQGRFLGRSPAAKCWRISNLRKVGPCIQRAREGSWSLVSGRDRPDRHPNRAGLVSMKWSWGYRWEQERSPDWQVSGAITLTSGFQRWRDSPFDRWVQGERSLPRVMERRNVLMALHGFNALEEPRPEGCNGSAQRAPLPRSRCSTPHILRVGLIDKTGKNGDA